MQADTLVSKYRRALDNNRAFALLVTATVLFSAIGATIASIKTLKDYFWPKELTFNEKVTSLAKKGCILFLPDSTAPVSDDASIMEAYKEFWRSTDIYYASRIEIEGFTHHRGTADYNLSLGDRKARSAASFVLNAARLVPEQTTIVTLSFGGSRALERAGEYECGALIRVFHDEP